MAVKGITVADFAKLENCSRRAVYDAIIAGRLLKLADGTLDPALVGSGWSAKNRQKATSGEAQAGPSKAVSEARREHVRAELAQIELDERLGSVASVDEMTEAVGKRLASLRTRLLAIPAEQAPAIARLKSPAEIEKKLRSIITAALEELSVGGPLSARH